MAALLSNAFGRKNLLGGGGGGGNSNKSGAPVSAADQLDGGRLNPADPPSRSRSATSDGDYGARSRSGTNEVGYGNNGSGANGNGNGNMGPPMNQPLWSPSQAQRPAAYHVNDPVSMHLMMENALEDSRNYEVLAPDAVKAVQTELDSVASRVEATRRKLALETKVRDAAKKMNQLEKIEEAQQAADRCAALQDELVHLQEEQSRLERKMLQHTSGVLQMTHKGYLKEHAEANVNGNGAAAFDLSHFYEPSMLLESLDSGGGTKMSAGQQDMIGTIQKKLESLNGQIREVLREFNAPARDIPPLAPSSNDSDSIVETTLDQINSLDQCFATFQRLQTAQKRDQLREQERLRDQLREQTTARGQADEAIEGVASANQMLHRSITRNGQAADIKLSPPPSADQALSAQLAYLSQVDKAILEQSGKLDSHETTLRGLWKTVANPERDGEYSLAGLAAKVQETNIRFANLEEQKDVLTRQIQQQREAAANFSGKDAEIAELREQLEKTQADLDRTEADMDSQIEKLSATIDDLEATKATLTAEGDADRDQLSKALESEKLSRQNEYTSQKASHEKALATQKTSHEKTLASETQARQTAEDAAQKAQQQLAEANSLMEVNSLAIKADLEAKIKALETAETAQRALEGEVARLQTELTIAKAELDGAYGTRAQRAAERDPELQARVKQLETELQETITDYESMTKATIEHEKEKDEMEAQLDGLRDKVESLETELAEERVSGMGGAKGAGESGATGAGVTSAAVLRTEFKKMMKDAREQHSKALKVRDWSRCVTDHGPWLMLCVRRRKTSVANSSPRCASLSAMRCRRAARHRVTRRLSCEWDRESAMKQAMRQGIFFSAIIISSCLYAYYSYRPVYFRGKEGRTAQGRAGDDPVYCSCTLMYISI